MNGCAKNELGCDPGARGAILGDGARASGSGGDDDRRNADDKRHGTTTKTRPRTEGANKPERPKLHKVILLNDDYTPREFVVKVLRAEFGMGDDRAYIVMMTAHQKGSCVVAVYPKDVAETKATRATDMAKNQGYPLMFTTEPEE